jgi:hypothetical protein
MLACSTRSTTREAREKNVENASESNTRARSASLRDFTAAAVAAAVFAVAADAASVVPEALLLVAAEAAVAAADEDEEDAEADDSNANDSSRAEASDESVCVSRSYCTTIWHSECKQRSEFELES